MFSRRSRNARLPNKYFCIASKPMGFWLGRVGPGTFFGKGVTAILKENVEKRKSTHVHKRDI